MALSVLTITCAQCGRAFEKKASSYRYWTARGRTAFFCTGSCRSKRIHEEHPEIGEKGATFFRTKMPKVFGRRASEETRAKQRAAKVGSRPTERGGNGKGLTAAETLLAKRLPKDFIPGFVVSLGRQRQGYPSNYKCDFASPMRMLIIEVDGQSHYTPSRRAQDRKKEAALRGLGWRVFRVTNKAVFARCSTSKLEAFRASTRRGRLFITADG